MVSFPHSLLRASQFFVFVFLGLVIAEFLFGIMAWVPVRAVGAVLAAVPLAYTGRRNLESLISSLGEWWVDQVLLEEMREMYRTVSWWIPIMEWIRSFWSNIYKSTLINHMSHMRQFWDKLSPRSLGFRLVKKIISVIFRTNLGHMALMAWRSTGRNHFKRLKEVLGNSAEIWPPTATATIHPWHWQLGLGWSLVESFKMGHFLTFGEVNQHLLDQWIQNLTSFW